MYALAVVQALSDHEAASTAASGTTASDSSHHPRMKHGDGADWSTCFPGLGI